MLRQIAFIARHDLLYNLRQRETLFWLIVMPPVFFFFIGSATGGFSSGPSARPSSLNVAVAEDSGILADQLNFHLSKYNFAVKPFTPIPEPDGSVQKPVRLLSVPPRFTERVLAGEETELVFESRSSALGQQYDSFRINRAGFTVLADIIAIRSQHGAEAPVTAERLTALNTAPRLIEVDATPAGNRRTIPSGFEQAIPGNLVMFTLLNLLTSGGIMLVIERRQGLLRRLGATPITRTRLMIGKWLARMGLGLIQVAIGALIGTILFSMDWGPNLPMVMVVLIAWAGFSASAAFLVGVLAETEAQAVGASIAGSMVLAALGGCWWPIEITPEWMQGLQMFLPTGWTMDALHKLISFQMDPMSVIWNLTAILAATVVLGALAITRFRYS